jgi:hypothetical protein
MLSTRISPSPVVLTRRTQLKRWIDYHFGGNQAAFGLSTNDGKTQINQGEVSGLLKEKSFGEKRARSLEAQAHMPPGYLDCDMDPDPKAAPTRHMVQETLYGQAPPLPLNRQIVWPFQLVSYGRINDLKKALGPRAGNEAIRELDKYLDTLVARWEREAAMKKKASAR